jgi:hypothetical protein
MSLVSVNLSTLVTKFLSTITDPFFIPLYLLPLAYKLPWCS